MLTVVGEMVENVSEFILQHICGFSMASSDMKSYAV